MLSMVFKKKKVFFLFDWQLHFTLYIIKFPQGVLWVKYFLSLGLCCSLSADPGEFGVVTEGSTSVNSGQTVTAVAPRIPVEISVMGPQGSVSTPGGFLCSPVKVLLLSNWQPLVLMLWTCCSCPVLWLNPCGIHPCSGGRGMGGTWLSRYWIVLCPGQVWQ